MNLAVVKGACLVLGEGGRRLSAVKEGNLT